MISRGGWIPVANNFPVWVIVLSFIGSALLTTAVQVKLQAKRDEKQAADRLKADDRYMVNANIAASKISEAANTAATTVESVRTNLVDSGVKVMDKLEQIHKLTNSTLTEARDTIAELRRYTANLERLLIQATAGDRPVVKPVRESGNTGNI
jgi:hypothetical protein